MKRHERQRLAEIIAYCRTMAYLSDDLASRCAPPNDSLQWGKAVAYRNVAQQLAPLIETGAPVTQGKAKS